jgi:hypothetical protein
MGGGVRAELDSDASTPYLTQSREPRTEDVICEAGTVERSIGKAKRVIDARAQRHCCDGAAINCSATSS